MRISIPTCVGLVAGLALFGACGSDGGPLADAGPADANPLAPDATPPCVGNHLLFLNRAGGTYVPSPQEDSRTNGSYVLWVNTLPEAVLPPAVSTDAEWDAIVECVRAKFGAFDLSVTDVDPGASGEYIEVAVTSRDAVPFGGSGITVSLSRAVCELAPRGLGFAFQAAMTDSSDVDENCVWITLAAAFAMGLEHATGPNELMSSAPRPAHVDAEFTDATLPCQMTPACYCGGTTQNSHQELLAALGPPICP